MASLAVGALALALAGCSSQASPRPAPIASTASRTAVPPTTGPAGPAPTTATSTGAGPGAPSPTGAGIIPCTPTVSTFSVAGGLSSVGHVGFSVHVRNASHEPCLTVGYPGVDVLAADGVVLQHAARTPDGFLGGLTGSGAPPHVVLQPGEEATAIVEGADGAGAGGCALATAIRFTLPNHTDSTVLDVSFPSCPGAQVHPLVRGDTGSG